MTGTTQVMKAFLLRLAYANVIVALGGLGYSVMACELAGITPRVEYVWPGFTTIFAAYNFDKCARLDPQDAINDPERSLFIARYRWVLVALAVLGLLVGGVLSARAGALGVVLYLSPFIGAVLYTLPVVPTRKGMVKIKEVTVLKSVWVASAWGFGPGLLPLVLAGAALDYVAFAALVFTTVRVFVNTVFFDLGDIAGDRAEGVATIPVRFGFLATRRMLNLLNLGFGLGMLGLTLGGWLPPIAHVFNGLTLYAAFYLSRAKSEQSEIGFTCDVVADGEGFVGALACLAVLALS
jgi:4-hydroxybenzoate polyprenyltransferase